MKIVNKIKTLRSLVNNAKTKGKTIGFVPTMGALHKGHLSLIKKCRKENDLCVLSIYVNPTQFGPKEDFNAYPRPKENDISLAKKENVDITFYPPDSEMYPPDYLTYISTEKITDVLCGKSRPGHFRGVTTVVGKLLNIVLPDAVYVGQKDAQQCVVIKQMIRDLNFSVKVRILPTVREADGLAMSSRNKYLTELERKEAPILYKALCLAKKKIESGERHAKNIKELVRDEFQSKTSAKIDYVECVNKNSLESMEILKGEVLIALAVYMGTTRLIDNIIVEIKNSDTIVK